MEGADQFYRRMAL